MQNPRVYKKLWEYYLAPCFALFTGGGKGKKDASLLSMLDYYNYNNYTRKNQEIMK